MKKENISQTREYQIWWRMKQNCYNPKASGYANLGAKGIKVDERWHDFDNFLTDMSKIPENFNALVRYAEAIYFCKTNCKWDYVGRGRKRLEADMRSLKKTKKCKVKEPQTICIVLERNLANHIQYLARHKSLEKKENISSNDLIREALKKAFPISSTIDIFGDNI